MSQQLIESLNNLEFSNHKYLKTCIKIYKPHFVIKYLKDYERKYYKNCNINEECIAEYKQQNKMKYVTVYDQEQNVKKLLIVFLSQYLFQHELNIMKDVLTKFYRKDLFLNLYDQYFLDPDCTFYVFETECFDINTKLLAEEFNISNDQIQSIFKRQKEYIFEVLNIQNKVEDEQDQINLYVNINNKNQIQVKLNLFDFFEEIQGLVIEKSNQYTYYQNIFKQNKKEEKEIMIDEKDIQYLSEQLTFYQQNQFSPLSKTKFQEKISQIDIQPHSISIFEVILQHPQYNDFELLQINSQTFQIRLSKSSRNILLNGIRFNSVKQVEDQEKEYEKMKVLTETNTFELGDCAYLLLELEIFNQGAENLISLSQLALKSLNMDRDIETEREAFKLMEFLIDFSYELLSVYNIRITHIDPNKIFVQNNTSLKDLQVIVIIGNCIQNSEKEYNKLISKFFEKLNFNYNDSISYRSDKFLPQMNHLNHYDKILSYLETIQKASKEEIQKVYKQYSSIKKMLEILHFVIELKQQLINFKIKVSKYNPFKICVDFKNSLHGRNKKEILQNIKNAYNFLIYHQEIINEIQFETSNLYSQIIKQQQQQDIKDQPQANQPWGNFLLNKNQRYNLDQNSSENQCDVNFLNEIGLIDTLGYNNYNIGLSVCNNLKNLQILNLEFNAFDFSIFQKNSNFFRFNDQIQQLILIFKSFDQNIIDLVKQIKQYKSINTIQIKINKSFFKQNLLRQTVKKIPRLVQTKIDFECCLFASNQILSADKNLGFFF